MENTLTLKQQNYILKLDPTRKLESLKDFTKKDASILIATLVKAAKHITKAHKKQAPSKTITHFEHGFNVGDVLYASWGWEQTNLDFFIVVAATEKTIRIKECVMQETMCENYSHGMARNVAFDPKTAKVVKDSFWIKDNEKGDLKRIGCYEYNGQKNYYVHLKDGRYTLSHYNGKKLYESWYA